MITLKQLYLKHMPFFSLFPWFHVIIGQKFRKSNLEDAKKNAIEAAKNRDESNSDPRRKDIPIEIASTTNKIDDLKIKIQNDTVIQQDLRRTFETQSAIEQMKGQCQTEIEELKEKISEYRFQFQAYKISPPPQDLPGADIDKRGEELKKVMETVSDEINDKFEERDRELTKTRDTIRRIEAIVSEKSALYNHDIQSIRNKQHRMSGLKPSIEKTRQVVEELRSFEARDEGISTPVAITENRPEELLSYLTERIGDIEGQSIEGISPDMIKRVMKKLFKLVRLKLLSYQKCNLTNSTEALFFLYSRQIPKIKIASFYALAVSGTWFMKPM